MRRPATGGSIACLLFCWALHWLLVVFRTQVKVLVILYQALDSLGAGARHWKDGGPGIECLS